MSYAAHVAPGHASRAWSPVPVAGILFAAVAAAVLTSAFTTNLLLRGQAAEPQGLALAAPVAPVEPVSRGTGVPDASTVFRGKASLLDEEPAPTF